MQTFSDVSNELHISALLVTKAEAIYRSVAQAVAPAKVSVRWEPEPAPAADAAREEQFPVVMVSADADWRGLLRALEDESMKPSVVLLCPSFNAELWTEALNRGAFEALSLSADRDRLIWTLGSAYRRWERNQLVRAALMQNPYAHVG